MISISLNFQSIAIAAEDKIEVDLESVLKSVDSRFSAVPYSMDGRKTLRYALRVGGDERFSVDFLSPMRGPDRTKIGSLPALRSDAQFLRYLDFLLYQETTSVALHGAGIPIRVPDPTRYALHKLIVSQMRRQDDQQSAEKSRKDLDQAHALISILAIQRPDDLKDFWNELCERGMSWRVKAIAGLAASGCKAGAGRDSLKLHSSALKPTAQGATRCGRNRGRMQAHTASLDCADGRSLVAEVEV